MKKISLLFTFFFYAILLGQNISGKVVAVIDGDTIIILDDSKNTHKIRLANIDCPEKNQPFGKKAKWFVSNLIYKKRVQIQTIGKDRYHRYIGNVYFDNKNISEELLKNGLAWHYRKYSKSKKLQNLEDKAKEKKLGLWSEKNPIEPYWWRKKH